MAKQYPALVAAQLRGATIRDAFLVRFDFTSGEMRLWSGLYDLKDLNGEIWTGAGNVGLVSEITTGPGQAIQEVTFTLFASAAMLAQFESDALSTTGREVRLYQQFFEVRQFDGTGAWVQGKPLDYPVQMFWGIMGPLIVDRPQVAAGDANPTLRTITLRAANAFVNRRKPPFAFCSQQDQIARSVGNTDNIFINASRMALTTVRWPKF